MVSELPYETLHKDQCEPILNAYSEVWLTSNTQFVELAATHNVNGRTLFLDHEM